MCRLQAMCFQEGVQGFIESVRGLHIGKMPCSGYNGERCARDPVAHQLCDGQGCKIIFIAYYNKRGDANVWQEGQMVPAIGPAAMGGGGAFCRCAAHHFIEMCVDGLVVHGGGGDVLVDRIVCMLPHACCDDQVCFLEALLMAFGGFSPCIGVHDDQGFYFVREEPVKIENDLASHGEAAEDSAVNKEGFQKM